MLNEITGVIHVGANTGQEIQTYNHHNLDVIWVEPITEVFKVLLENIKNYPKHIAYNSLITDTDNKEYDFHIANNYGQSSSIYGLKKHKQIWPDIHYIANLRLKSITLKKLIQKTKTDIRKYQALIIDTQGSELLILKGATDILHHFKFITLEVADFESYENCCKLSDIEAYMEENNFYEYERHLMVSQENVGNYYDITYRSRQER